MVKDENPADSIFGLTDAQVSVVMGSVSDWDTMKNSVAVLSVLGVLHEYFVVSAHRTPLRTHQYATTAEPRGVRIIIAGAGGAAHLPGLIASMTHLPVIGVPIQSKALGGVDSLYSIVQMPPGVPVATMAIGVPGAINAALYAARILALYDPALRIRLLEWIEHQTASVALKPDTD